MIIPLLKKYVTIINGVLIGLIAVVFGLVIHDNITKPALSTSSVKAGSYNNEINDKKDFSALSNPKPKEFYQTILTKNIFKLKNVDTELNTLNASSSESVRDTKLRSLILLATVSDSVNSIAIIKNSDNNKAGGYKPGEVVDIYKNEKITIARIEPCKAVLERRSGYETIKCLQKTKSKSSSTNKTDKKHIRQPAKRFSEGKAHHNNPKIEEGIVEIGENQFEIDQDLFDELLGDMNSIIAQMRIIPQDDGIKLFGIRRDTFFYKIGLRNGDILHSVNEVELNDIENALGIFEELKGQASFSINLSRRKEKITYEYNVK